MARNKKGFTLIELLVVISIIALLIGLLMPALATARRSAQKIQNMSNIRSIGQSFAAGASSNKGWWAGYNGRVFDDGTKVKIDGTAQSGNGSDPNLRAAKLLSKGEIDAKVLVSPAEQDTEVTVYETGDFADPTIGERCMSYSMLGIGEPAGGNDFKLKTPAPSSRVAWKNSNSASSPVISDRNLGTVGDGTMSDISVAYSSNFSSDQEESDWKGHVQFADTHVEFLQQATLQRTSYGSFTKKMTEAQYNALSDEAAHKGTSGTNGADGLFDNNDNGKDCFMISKAPGSSSGGR